MVQSIMIFGIGFLSAALAALAFMPQVHSRAVRLTAARLDDAIPASVQELNAEKDQMRSQVAMSLRRLEIVIENLKKANVAHQTEITRKTERLNSFQEEAKSKAAMISMLEDKVGRLQNELSAAITERDTTAGLLLTAQQSLANKEVELGRLSALASEQQRRLADCNSIVADMQKNLEKSDSLIVSLQRDLQRARDRELSVSDLHRQIDKLENRIKTMALEFAE